MIRLEKEHLVSVQHSRYRSQTIKNVVLLMVALLYNALLLFDLHDSFPLL